MGKTSRQDNGQTATSEAASEDRTVLQRVFRSERENGKGRWLEILAAIVLAFATIATAWSGYQATRWSGVQSVSFFEASSNRVESVRSSNLAAQKAAVDIGLFVQYATAYSEDNEALVQFLEERFRPEFKVAMDAWLATDPANNPDAPSSPFDMEEYVLADAVSAQDYEAVAEEKAADARQANQTGDNYILTTVLFASVLFFAGISPKFRSLGVRIGVLSFGIVVFLFTLAVQLSYPVH